MESPIFLLDAGQKSAATIEAALGSLGLSPTVVESLGDLTNRYEGRGLLFVPLPSLSSQRLADLRRLPGLDSVVLGSQNTIEEATEVMREGAWDYLPLPLTQEAVKRAVERWQARSAMATETARLSEMLTLMELGRTLTSTLRLEALYEQIIHHVDRAFTPDAVSLMVLDSENRRLRLVAQRGLSAGTATGTVVSIEESIAGQVVREGHPQLLLGGLQGTPFAKLARRGGRIGSAMSIPLSVQRRILGVLNVSRMEGQPNYTEDDANLLHVFASHIAIALQNAQLYESLTDERDRIIKAQEDVRRELARDLHDGLTQVLAALTVSIDHLCTLLREGRIGLDGVQTDLEFIRATARQAIHDARTTIFGLRPLVLETKGLAVALDHYVGTMRDGDQRARYHLDDNGFDRSLSISPNVARMIFAIMQEAINNARKHAHAQNIWVRLHAEQDGAEQLVRAVVQDDGKGFDLEQVEDHYDERYSFGLLNMKERANLIDAALRLDSGPGGTTVALEIPLHEQRRV